MKPKEKEKEKESRNRIEEFYNNWYFFTEYKTIPHYKDAHKIRYE